MTVFDRRPALRWLVPVAVAAVVVGGGAAVGVDRRRAPTPALPPRTAAQLLVDVQNARLDGAVRHRRADAPTSACPSLPERSAAQRQLRPDLAGVRHRTRCGSGTPARTRRGSRCSARSASPTSSATARDVWTWSSQDNARHPPHRCRARPDGATAAARADRRRRMHPAAGGRRGAAAIDPTTKVTHRRHGRGRRPAPTSWCSSPEDAGSLVGSVRIAIDGESTSRCGCRCSPRAPPSRPSRSASPRSTSTRPDASRVPVQPAARRQGHRAGDAAGQAGRATRRHGADAGPPAADGRRHRLDVGWWPHGRRHGLDRRVVVGHGAGAATGSGAGALRQLARAAARGCCRQVSGALGHGPRCCSGTLFSRPCSPTTAGCAVGAGADAGRPCYAGAGAAVDDRRRGAIAHRPG